MNSPRNLPPIPDPTRGRGSFVFGFMLGVALCTAFALGVWMARGSAIKPVAPVVAAGLTPRPPVQQASVSVPQRAPEVANLVRDVPPERSKPNAVVADEAPAPAAPPAVVPLLARSLAVPERFALEEPPAQTPEPFLLPRDPWFALGPVSADEPEPAAEETVCAADRTLNTAITWARSPAEASEQARREGKLVFLIHVSGNFENPGFT